MNKNEQIACQHTQKIEKDYIDNMLGMGGFSNALDNSKDDYELVDFNKPYKKTDFECQIFNIAGLKIAVATESIGEIVKHQPILQDSSKQLAVNILAGTINVGGKIINVINLERLIMNGIDNFDEITTNGNDPADIFLLKKSSASFIGNQLVDCQIISNKHVHWRGEESKRIWLAGTVVQMGLILLDIEGVIKILSHNK